MKSIMLVTDNDEKSKTILRLLRAHTYTITSAKSGIDALDKLALQPVKVLVTHQNMPYMTGVELATQVKQLYPSIITIIITESDICTEVKDALDEGMVHKLIHTPWEETHLCGAIESALTVSQRQAEEKGQHLLDAQNRSDRLTRLPNRDAFKDALHIYTEEAASEDRRIVVIFVNIRHFKNVNTALGEEAGDIILKSFAERLRTLAKHDEYIARIGGVEFGLFLKLHPKEIILDYYLVELYHKLTAPFLIHDQEIYLRFNIGVSLYPDHAKDVESLLRCTFIALHEAKLAPAKHFHYYEPKASAESALDFALENDLHKALDREEILLYFQPQVDINSGKIVGAETLLRWQHQDKGIIPPNQFIPLAENSGLIISIERWAMMQACFKAKLWQEKYNIDLHFSLNLSVKEFVYPGLLQYIRCMITDTEIDPKTLILEVTESVLMENIQNAFETLNKLKDIGVKIALDDFGTGYSSLNYLVHIPFDIIKIDREFTNKIMTDERALFIIEATDFIANKLAMDVVVEGIETEEQLCRMRELGFTNAQGFYFYKPMPENEFEKAIQNQLK